MKELLDETYKVEGGDVLLGYGGHPGAAGLTVAADRYDEFYNTTMLVAKSYGYTPPETVEIVYDLEIPASEIASSVSKLAEFAPYGEGNPRPVFKVTGFDILPVDGKFINRIGEKGIKFQGSVAEAVSFDIKEIPEGEYRKVTLYGYLGKTYFQGEERLQVEFFSMENETPQPKVTDLAAKLKNMAKAKTPVA